MLKIKFLHFKSFFRGGDDMNGHINGTSDERGGRMRYIDIKILNFDELTANIFEFPLMRIMQ